MRWMCRYGVDGAPPVNPIRVACCLCVRARQREAGRSLPRAGRPPPNKPEPRRLTKHTATTKH